MKRIIYIVFAAVVLTMVPATYASAQGHVGRIETPKERQARLNRESAEKKKTQQQEAAAKKKREQTARVQAECNARLRSCGEFHEGLAAYKDVSGKWGYIAKTGKVVIPCKWKKAGVFHEGLAVVVDDKGKLHKIDKTGKIVQ